MSKWTLKKSKMWKVKAKRVVKMAQNKLRNKAAILIVKIMIQANFKQAVVKDVLIDFVIRRKFIKRFVLECKFKDIDFYVRIAMITM